MDPIARKAKNYRINSRIRRIEAFGTCGDCEPVGAGVYELKLDTGPGYRVYFGIDGNEIILLGGGAKDTQDSDIRKAQECWEDYNA